MHCYDNIKANAHACSCACEGMNNMDNEAMQSFVAHSSVRLSLLKPAQADQMLPNYD